MVCDDVERVDSRPEALRHASPVGGEHGRVDDHVPKRDVVHELEAGEDHPVLPEADDLPRGRVQIAGVVRAQVGGVVRPAQRGERPERGREPGVEDVLLPSQLGRVALGARLGLGLGDDLVAVRAVPDRKLVTPPELARDVPVRCVLERVGREAVLRLRVVDDLALLEGGERGLLQLLHRAPPLQRDEGLDAGLAALAERDRVAVALTLLEEPALFRPRDDPLARLFLGQAGEVACLLVHASVGGDDRRLRQVVAPADGEVERVVCRSHLERSRTELRVDLVVGDHRDVPLDVRDDDLAPDRVAIALVVGMDCDRDVARDRGGPGGRDRHAAFPVHERIREVGERVVDVHVDQLEIGERRLVERAPVDDPVRLEDPALLVQMDEEAHDRADVVVVHREALAPVVERGADAPELGHDRAPVKPEPFPDSRLEGLAAEVVARLSLAGEVLLDRVLRRDARVVVAGLEERVEALHALHADERVGQRELERVSHVQLPGDVRRRVGDHEGWPAALGVRLVEALGLPRLLPALFDAFGLVQRLHAVILGALFGRTVTLRSAKFVASWKERREHEPGPRIPP